MGTYYIKIVVMSFYTVFAMGDRIYRFSNELMSFTSIHLLFLLFLFLDILIILCLQLSFLIVTHIPYLSLNID